jgi:hypothetical protein
MTPVVFTAAKHDFEIMSEKTPKIGEKQVFNLAICSHHSAEERV